MLIGTPESDGELRHAEVDDLHEVAAGLRALEEDVVRLEIAVNDAGDVRGAEPVEQLEHHRRGDRWGVRRPARLDALRERLAVEELHDHVPLAARELAEIEHLDDVLGADVSRRLGLALEPLARRRVVRDARVQHLDGHAMANADVLAFVDRTHTALAEQPDDPVLVVEERSELELHRDIRHEPSGG